MAAIKKKIYIAEDISLQEGVVAASGSCHGSHTGLLAPLGPPRSCCWCLKQLQMGPSRGFWLYEIVVFYFFLCLCHPPTLLPGMGPASGPALAGHHTTLQGAPRCLGCSMPHVGVQHAAVQGASCSILGLTGWSEEGITAMLQTDFSL